MKGLGGKRGTLETGNPAELEGRDLLTGVWSQEELKKQITRCMRAGGALFLCDINHMKRINSQYGHRVGDSCLCQTARTLGYLIREKDILGRIGGDEFAVFMPGFRDKEAAQGIGRRITERFASDRRKDSKGAVPSVSIGIAIYRAGDTWFSLLQRAEEDLLRRRGEQIPAGEARKGEERDQYRKDVRQVRQDLMEQIRRPGAYCRDYEAFKSIYRFLERGLIRSGQKACTILLSVVDETGRILEPSEKDQLMERLGENIRSTLRIGDVYTRYTSSQYLVLVIDTTEHLADEIAKRVSRKFLSDGGARGLLIHYCYELQPAAKIWETEQEWTEMEKKSCG